MFDTLLELNDDFNNTLDSLENSRTHMFVTGKAGTGKSTLLRLFRNSTRKKVAVLAPTGIAALNVQGQTVHSFFGLPPRITTPDQWKPGFHTRQLIRALDTLIIDEISMVRADVIDLIDHALRFHRRSDAPFGGVQMVFFGDLFQLPPVVTQNERPVLDALYPTPYFFSANVLREDGTDFQIFELRKVFRQESRHFLNLLESVRLNECDTDTFQDLNARYEPSFPAHKPGYITLSARNQTAEAINQALLNRIAAPEMVYYGKVEGEFQESAYPTDQVMRLRVGAQVMFVRNDSDNRYVNGTIGVIKTLEADKIEVEIETEYGRPETVTVEQTTWENTRYRISPDDPQKIEQQVIGKYKQYPLKLAWAITIHKSQGKTFDKCIIDLGTGAFEHGQVYVALSRCRSLDGVVLRQQIRNRDIITDPRVLEFYEAMR